MLLCAADVQHAMLTFSLCVLNDFHDFQALLPSTLVVQVEQLVCVRLEKLLK